MFYEIIKYELNPGEHNNNNNSIGKYNKTYDCTWLDFVNVGS